MNITRIIKSVVCGSLLGLAVPSPSAGQSPSGALYIVVSGMDGAPIPGATVQVSSPGLTSKRVAYTDDAGACLLSDLPAGTYRVEVDLTGFARAELHSIGVRPGARTRADLTIRLQLEEEPSPRAPPKPADVQKKPAISGAPERPARDPASAPAPGEPLRNRRDERQGIAGRNPGDRFQDLQQAFQSLTLLPPESADASLQSAGSTAGAAGAVPDALGANAGVGGDAVAAPLLLSGSINTGAAELNSFGFRGGQFGGEFFGDRPESGAGGQAVVNMRGPGGAFGSPGSPGQGPGGMTMGDPFGGFPGQANQRGGRGGPFGRAAANRIRGAASLNYRNSVFDARPYSLSGQEIRKLPYTTASFNLTLGGPLKIPHLFDAGDRTSFFLNYGGSRGRNTQDTTTTVPTLEQRAGDFSRTLVRGQRVTLFDPLSASGPSGSLRPFSGNIIPVSRIDPIARGLLAYIPLPNLPGSVQNFHLEQALAQDSDRLVSRVDRRLSNKDNLTVTYFFMRQRSEQGQIFPGLLTTASVRNQNLNLEYTRAFKPSLINLIRFTYNRSRVQTGNPFAFQDDVEGRLGITGVSRDPINFGVPTLAFTNFGSLSLSHPRLVRNQTTSFSDNITITRKAHTWTGGADFRRVQLNTTAEVNARGTFTFSGLLTSDFDSAGQPLPNTGFDWADFLLGLPQATSIRFGGNNTYFRSSILNVFLQDNWRVKSSLSLTLGARYELATPPHEKYDRIANLDIARGFADAAVVTPGSPGPFSGAFPRALVETDKNNIAPRVGLAYRPFRSTRATIRAGYGLFYNPSVYNQFASQLASQPPFAVAQNLLTGPRTPLTLANGFPSDPTVTIRNTYAIDRSYRIGYVQNWNLTVQQQLTRTWVLELGYVGGKGTRLDLLLAPNRAPLGSSPLETGGSRRIGEAQGFLYQTAGASSTVHSLQARLAKRFTRGISFNLSYTFGKSIDNASNIGGGPQLVVQDDSNFSAERGLSSFDVRHRFQGNYNYELPFGPRRRFFATGLRSRLLDGWSSQGTITLATGAPLTPRVLGNAINNSGTGANQSERPDATGQPVELGSSNVSRFFNTSAFALPGPGRFGNAGRHTIPGPATALVDFSLGKRIALGGEGRALEFRWQASNLFNTPNFGAVDTTVNSTNFGRVTSVRTMRRMEFLLRYRF